jgi:hypothetical protein
MAITEDVTRVNGVRSRAAMHGVVSLLDQCHYARLVDIWRDLESRIGLRSERPPVYPHVSYHVAQEYEVEASRAAIQALASDQEPFEIETAGLGIFAGPDPVLYLALKKTPTLSGYQKKIWFEMQNHSSYALDYYEPDRWVPHITVASGGLRPELLYAALQDLSERNLEWTIGIDNLGLLTNYEGNKELSLSTQLSGNTRT